MPECYIPYQQHFFGSLNVLVRTTADPAALANTLRQLVRADSTDVSVKFTTLERDASEGVAAPRFRTLLFGIFAALAVCLAMAGVYGVMAFAVSQRSNEIGLRIALGASRESVLGLFLLQGLTLAVVGLALGLVIAIVGTRLLTTMLFQVKPNDPSVYVGVTILLGLVTLVACYIPARRAASTDPITVLRQE
jgi:putative ABC transport system permease protein